MDPVREVFHRDRFARHAGIELVSVAPGHAVTRMPLQDFHLNGLGVVQGGAIFTLADFAFAAAVNAAGQVAVAINASITFMKSVEQGTLTADAREVAAHARLATYAVTVTQDEGSLIATFQGLAYRKKETVEAALAQSKR